ncbi:tail assembly protein [Arsenophonus apicola]|uniref:tail assembly protein n=1 Tax=Arsenophonus apicola TaxID=2879119 RepID=UPI00387A5B25
MNELKTVRLYGQLGVRFGRVHQLAISSPKEAIKALSVLYHGFERYLADAHLTGIEFAIFKGKQNMAEQEFHLNTIEDIRIAPIIKGSKRGGFFQTMLGVAMIGLAVWNPAFLDMSSTVAGALMAGGVSMALGGVVQLLSPQPQGPAIRQEADNKPSYAFGGAVNTTAQGNPVPLLYTLDRKEIGGAIISAGIYTEDQK